MNPTDHLLLTLRILSASIALRSILPFAKLPRLLELIESRQRNVHMEETRLNAIIEKIDRIARLRYFVIRNNCLNKNLLFYYFLVRSGVKDVTIHIGVSKTDAKLDGHCWLTRNGRLYMETEENVAKYAVIYSSGV